MTVHSDPTLRGIPDAAAYSAGSVMLSVYDLQPAASSRFVHDERNVGSTGGFAGLDLYTMMISCCPSIGTGLFASDATGRAFTTTIAVIPRNAPSRDTLQMAMPVGFGLG